MQVLYLGKGMLKRSTRYLEKIIQMFNFSSEKSSTIRMSSQNHILSILHILIVELFGTVQQHFQLKVKKSFWWTNFNIKWVKANRRGANKTKNMINSYKYIKCRPIVSHLTEGIHYRWLEWDPKFLSPKNNNTAEEFWKIRV